MKRLFALALLALAACGAPPQQTAPATAENSGALEIRDAWAPSSPNGVDVAAGYLTIANGGPADRLIALASARAAKVEVHEMSMDGAVMRMRPVEGGLAVPAGEAVTLSPAGLHLMFSGVTQPFAAGEEIPLTLTFERAGVREARLLVRGR